ncbi:MAG TPA: Gfo/Idh/MocA family oxidoreductase [Acidobacteriaceae bacterium]
MPISPFDRREFLRLSALAVAAAQTPAFAQTPSSAPSDAAQPAAGPPVKPIGYAAVGLGTISGIFMRACAKSQTAKITALVTGHPDTKGKRFAEMYGIPETSIYTYEQYEKLRDNKDVDAVYIGMPNSMHKEYTIRGAQAGKHVLCEKPMAISSAECRQMTDACRAAGRKLMIAYRVHYEPTHIQARQMIQSGAIGKVQAFEGAFGFNAGSKQWRQTKQYSGGGSLLDVGIYPLNESRWITGEEPVNFTAIASTRDTASGIFSEIEETLAFAVKFPSGIVGSYNCTYGADMPGYLRIHGDRGSLEITHAYDYSGVHLASLGGRNPVDITTPRTVDHFQIEAEYFANCIRTGTDPLTGGEEGFKDLLAMEAIYKAAGTPMA